MKNQIRRIVMSRRDFLKKSAQGVGLAAMSTLPLFRCSEEEDTRYFYFAAIADTHIIDDFYSGPEGNAYDTETIFNTIENYTHVKDVINSINPGIDLTIIAGDYFHNYPSQYTDFYYENKTRLHIAHEISGQFKSPVYPGFGNHDYDIGSISRETSHHLFETIFGLQPYYSVNHKGWKFISLNNFLGNTMDTSHSDFNDGIGSFGEEQLNWLDSELAQGMPSVLYFHFPFYLIKKNEVSDLDIFSVMDKYPDNVMLTLAGHIHMWGDLEDNYGPQHYVLGSTRYDEDCYLIVEVDTLLNTYNCLNLNLVTWGDYAAEPYV